MSKKPVKIVTIGGGSSYTPELMEGFRLINKKSRLYETFYNMWTTNGRHFIIFLYIQLKLYVFFHKYEHKYFLTYQ